MPAALTALALSRLLGPWNTRTGPAYRELADVIRLLILDGRIPLDTALPSERALCAALDISRTTVTAAYSSLREQGFLSSGQGSRGRTRIPELTPFGSALFGPQPPSTGALPAPGLTAPGLTAPGLTAPAGISSIPAASSASR